jgi:hypothetical protein
MSDDNFFTHGENAHVVEDICEPSNDVQSLTYEELKDEIKYLKGVIEMHENLVDETIAKLEVENTKLEDKIKKLEFELNNQTGCERSLLEKLEEHKNKLNQKDLVIQEITSKYNSLEQEHKLLVHKYEYIKSQYDKFSNEDVNAKIFNNVKSLTKQNKILLENNNVLSEKLFNTKKNNLELVQKLDFLAIDYKILSEYHEKYKLDTTNTINVMKEKFGLLVVDTNETEDDVDCEDEDSDTESEVNIAQKISVFTDNKGIKKMIINGKNYKLTNQNIDFKNVPALQKEYEILYKKYVK